MSWTFLAEGSPHWLHVWRGPTEALAQDLRTFQARPGCLAGLRWLRGSRMRTKPGLLEEWAAAAQFQPTFGGNWDAFRDALSDHDGPGFVVFDAAQMLQDAPLDEFCTFYAILAEVAGSAFPRPFHLVLQADAGAHEALIQDLRALGLRFDVR